MTNLKPLPPREGSHQRCLSILAAFTSRPTILRNRSRLRTATQILVVSLVSLGGVGVLRAPHFRSPAAKAQNTAPDPWAGLEIQPAGFVPLDDPIIGQSDDFGPPPAQPTNLSTAAQPIGPNYITDVDISNQANQNIAPRPPDSPPPTSPNTGTHPAVGGGTGTAPFVEYSLFGIDQTTAVSEPPDTHGTVGSGYYIEVVNDELRVYPRQKSSVNAAFPDILGPAVKDCTLEQLFSISSGTLFDPRVIYDRTTDRYIITADSFQNASGHQYVYIAVSKPGTVPFSKGSYIIQTLNITGANQFYDFPSVGIDQNAILITGNVLPLGKATLFTIPKSRLYSDPTTRPVTPYNVPYYSGLQATLQPPIKLDSTPYTFLLAAPYAGFHYPGSTALAMYRLGNTDQAAPRLYGPYYIQVPGYYTPRSARQPGTGQMIDTADNRFQAQSTQIGASLFNVHCINSLSAEQGPGAYPTNCWYEVGTGADNPPYGRPYLKQRQMFHVSAYSDDFNPSLAVDDNKNVYLNWNATWVNSRNSSDPNTNKPVQVWCTARAGTDAVNTLRPFALEYQSQSSYFIAGGDEGRPANVVRWGDYSFVAIDPLASGRAWGVQETVYYAPKAIPGISWASQIWRFNMGGPPAF